MSLIANQWTFWPEEQRNPEQNERWWKNCYVPAPAEVTLRGIVHSVIVSGGPGCGKSTALKALARLEGERLCLVHYPLVRWPGEVHAWTANYGHLGQIMACASMELKNLLAQQPDKLKELSKVNLEYLRWLIQKYSGERAFRRWADALDYQPLLDLVDQPFDDLYSTDTELPDVQGQIEELVTLSQRLGYEGVAVLVDLHQAEVTRPGLVDKMRDLFGWLTPLQFEGLAIKAVLPQQVIEQADLLNKTRGRVAFAALHWSVEDCRNVSNRHLQIAAESPSLCLTDLASPELLTALETRLTGLSGEPTPQIWVWLAASLLKYASAATLPVKIDHEESVIHAYFADYIPLRFDRSRRAVWRGREFIPLDEQPFGFLEILWQYRHSEYEANEALLAFAFTRGNLNTLASRLRQKIEPAPRQPVYLRNSRSRGYWLENVIEAI